MNFSQTWQPHTRLYGFITYKSIMLTPKLFLLRSRLLEVEKTVMNLLLNKSGREEYCLIKYEILCTMIEIHPLSRVRLSQSSGCQIIHVL
jgi:hypothetical protein